jgi:HK97 family phage major capsid protein
MVRRLPVGSNSNSGWINGVNETDRATGSRWGGIRGYRLAESGTKTASAPKFRRLNWELKKYAVLVYGTDELLADASQFSAVVRIGVSEELVFMLNDDILNGAGAAGPQGIVNSGALVTVAKETNQAAATIVTRNLSNMWSRLLPRSKANAAWFVNSDTMPQLDELAIPVGTGALEPRFVNYGPDGIMRIKGKPVYETEFNATLGQPLDIVLADMTEYLLWEKGGVQEAQSIHVSFLTDETVFRFVYRCDGKTTQASPVTPYKGSSTQSAFVALAIRS